MRKSRIFLQSEDTMKNAYTQRVSLSLLFVTTLAFGQSAPAFEVASIKKAEPLSVNSVLSGQMKLGMTIDAAMVHITALSLTELLRVAYKVNTFQISGPDWLGAQRFDITAKMPAGAGRDQVPEMIQALLAERFKLTLHRSTTEQSVYELVIAKSGLKLQESAPDTAALATAPGAAAAPTAPTPTDGGAQVRAAATSEVGGAVTSSGINGTAKMFPSDNGLRIELIKMNTIGVVDLLGRFVDRPIVDKTGLKGKYDLTLEIGRDEMIALARAQGMAIPVQTADRASEPGSSSIFAAIQQYGLKLEPRKDPIELLVIDHVEKSPTEN